MPCGSLNGSVYTSSEPAAKRQPVQLIVMRYCVLLSCSIVCRCHAVFKQVRLSCGVQTCAAVMRYSDVCSCHAVFKKNVQVSCGIRTVQLSCGIQTCAVVMWYLDLCSCHAVFKPVQLICGIQTCAVVMWYSNKCSCHVNLFRIIGQGLQWLWADENDILYLDVDVCSGVQLGVGKGVCEVGRGGCGGVGGWGVHANRPKQGLIKMCYGPAADFFLFFLRVECFQYIA